MRLINGVATGVTGDAFACPRNRQDSTPLAVYGYGTFGGATITIQVSPDGGVTWVTANNILNTDITFTAAGMQLLWLRATHVRAITAGGAAGAMTVDIR